MITEVTAFKVGNILFDTKEEAEKFEYETLSDLKLGDTVSHRAKHRDVGICCCIQPPYIYWAVGNIPPQFVAAGTCQHGGKNIKINNIVYNWEIRSHYRHNLIRHK